MIKSEFLLISFLLTLTFLGCENQSSEVSASNKENLPRVYSTAKWPVYSTLDELTAKSDLIIVGQTVKQDPGRLVPDMSSTVGLPTTDTIIFVETVLKGDVKVKSNITVEQTGGTYVQTNRKEQLEESIPELPVKAGETSEGYAQRLKDHEEEKQNFEEIVWLELQEDPLFIVGEKDLLFLDWVQELNIYQFIPQGRYKVEANKLVSLYPEDSVSKYLNKKALDRALKEISAFVNLK